MQFAENFHQSKPEPVQFARAARLIMAEDPSLTAAEVSRIVGAPPAWTRKALRLLELPGGDRRARRARRPLLHRRRLRPPRGRARRRHGREGRGARRGPRRRRRSAASSSSTASATSRRRRRTTRRPPTGSTPRAARPPAAPREERDETRRAAREPAYAAPRLADGATRLERRRPRRLRPRRVPLSLRDRRAAQAAADHGRGRRARVRPLAAPARAPRALRSLAREAIEAA